jgi:hypothetical protein
MKRCPTCNRTFTDDSLSFCLDDGAPLLSVSDAPSSGSFDPGATMRYTEARDTSPPTEVYRPSTPPPSNQVVNPTWSPGPSAQAARKSSILPWVIGGGVLLLLVGIGLIVLIAAIIGFNSSKSSNRNSNNSNNSNGSANRSNRNSANSNGNSNNSNNSNSGSSATMRDDFSSEKWLTGTTPNGTYWYKDDEYHMHATANSSVVVYAPNKDDYYTEDSTVRVTARSVSGTSPRFGYGVAVLGEMKDNQLEDYSFLIYTGNDPQYKVVLHKSGKETPMVNWTKTSTIRTGTSPNQLEVRVKGDQMSFYINGQYATSIRDTAGYKAGVVGLYSSETYEIVFDDLEIDR